MAILLKGRELAASLRQELKRKVAELPFTPHLGVVLVGDDPASQLYVSLKEQAATEVGIAVEKVLLPAVSTAAEVKAVIERFNQQTDIHGILLQLPLPQQLDEHEVVGAMDPNKDADGFHPENLRRFQQGELAITPGVSEGIMRLIDLANQALTGRSAMLVVNSQEFARPLEKLLRDRGVHTTVTSTVNPNELRQADIIVVAVGQPGIITSACLKDGAIVIDVGTTKLQDRVVGDVESTSLVDRPIYLTPVPGGVGPMTVVMLLWNVYRLAQRIAVK